MALFLQECFPKARIIHLTRDVADCFISLKKWEDDESNAWIRPWTVQALDNWQRINQSFIDYHNMLNNYMFVRYEDMVGEPKQFINDLSAFLSLPADDFDQSVFKNRLTTTGLAGKIKRTLLKREDLTPEERALFSSEAFRNIGEQYGYKIDHVAQQIEEKETV